MTRTRNSFRPILEGLEERIVPYSLSGYQWANVNVSASYMPDGTITDNGSSSNLFATLNAVAPTATWQREFARALQTWASVSPLNFHFVSDNGAAVASAGSTQGDSHFGDIRLGGYVFGNTYVGFAYYPAGGTVAGDEFLNTAVTWHIGTYLDLYSVLLHESGHALGLDHSTSGTVMYATITAVYTGLSADDIAGIQAIYGTRQPDAYDAAASNGSFATATPLSLDGAGAVTASADLTTLADVDYFRVTAPPSFDGTLSVSVDAGNLSLLTPKISVYGAAQNLLGTASASSYGGTATLTLSGLTPGQTYYLVPDGATSDVFGMGAYRLSATFGGATVLPSLTITNVSLTEGDGGTKLFNFTVTLSAASSSPVTVQYSTANGTATAGSDYTATSGTLTFAPGETQKTVAVSVNGDTVAEANETFFVNLSAPTNAVLGASQGQGTIQNDDVAADGFEVNDTSATATNFGTTNSVSQSNLTLHTAADLDYYRFSPRRRGTFRVTITPSQGSGTINLTVLNAQQAVLGSGQSATGAVTLTLSLSTGQQYYVKATSASGSLFTYALSIVKSGAGGGATAEQDGELGDGTEALGIFPAVADQRNHFTDLAGLLGATQLSLGNLAAGAAAPQTWLSQPSETGSARKELNTSPPVQAVTAPAGAEVQPATPGQVSGDLLSGEDAFWLKLGAPLGQGDL